MLRVVARYAMLLPLLIISRYAAARARYDGYYAEVYALRVKMIVMAQDIRRASAVDGCI